MGFPYAFMCLMSVIYICWAIFSKASNIHWRILKDFNDEIGEMFIKMSCLKLK